MSTPTTDAAKFVETPDQLAWRTEFGRLCNVQKELHDEMALLTPTLELTMKYEKLYILASDNIMHHCVPDVDEYRVRFRNSAHNRPRIVPIGGGEDPTRAFYDWDDYFFGRKFENYCVSSYFKRG